MDPGGLSSRSPGSPSAVSTDVAFGVASLDDSGLATYLEAHEAGSRAAEGMAKRLLGGNDLESTAKAVLRTFVVEIRIERAHLTSRKLVDSLANHAKKAVSLVEWLAAVTV